MCELAKSHYDRHSLVTCSQIITCSVYLYLSPLSTSNIKPILINLHKGYKRHNRKQLNFFSDGTRALLDLIIELHDHTQTSHTRYVSSGRVISPAQRPIAESINTNKRQISMPLRDSNPQSQQANGRRPSP
jgi:hypothetical protein